MTEKKRVAIIGCGYWGNHLIRNFFTSNNWILDTISDIDPKQLEKQANMYSGVKATTNPDDIFSNPNIDAVAIATPVFSHYDLALKSLSAGKHTWVEKPLTYTAQQSANLISLANNNNVLLHVDHTFIYTTAVRKIKEIIDSGELGDFLYFDSVRVNLGLFQHDINVLWDLAPHDLSILQYCIGKKPVSVNATGNAVIKYGNKDIENIAYMTVNFDDGTLAHFHVNWISPVKIRKIIIGGTKKMLVFDDMQQSEKIKVYDSGVNISSKEDIYETLIQYRTGDMYSPAIGNKEALKEEVEHFYECIANAKTSLTPGESGLYVVNLLAAAEESIRNNGKMISL